MEEVAKNVRNKKFDTESRKKVFKLTPLNQGESPKHLKYNFDDQKYDMKPLWYDFIKIERPLIPGNLGWTVQ